MARSTKKHQKTGETRFLIQPSRPAKPLFRLIPVTMLMAGSLLALKTVEIYQSGRALHQELLVSSVIAQDQSPAAETAAAATTTTATPAEAPAADTPASAPGPNAPVDVFADRDRSVNQRELDVLENLSDRREKIEKLERELALREKVLQATESRIDQKLKELNAMSEELKALLVAYDDEEKAKIASLVKIYEAMKPKDAARIFDELDMDILLLVVDRMSERRVAPVLASMSPQKAKEVTEQLADQQRKRPNTGDAFEPGYSPPLF